MGIAQQSYFYKGKADLAIRGILINKHKMIQKNEYRALMYFLSIYLKLFIWDIASKFEWI